MSCPYEAEEDDEVNSPLREQSGRLQKAAPGAAVLHPYKCGRTAARPTL